MCKAMFNLHQADETDAMNGTKQTRGKAIMQEFVRCFVWLYVA